MHVIAFDVSRFYVSIYDFVFPQRVTSKIPHARCLLRNTMKTCKKTMKTCKKPPPKYNDLVLARDRAKEASDRIKAQDKERQKKKREEKKMEKEKQKIIKQRIEKDKMNDVMPAW